MMDCEDRTLLRFVRRRWLVCVGISVAIALLQSMPEAFSDEPIATIVLRCLLYVVQTPLEVVALSAAFDLATSGRRGPTAVLLASLVVSATIGALLALGFVYVFQGLLRVPLDEKGLLEYPLVAAFGVIGAILTAGVWGLAFVAPYLSEQAQRRRLETEQLRFEAERLKVASELAFLRSQLEPHFLLNTLNTIAGHVTQHPREARRLLGCLGDLLRELLQSPTERQPLRREVAWLRRYAEILESRHGGALRFEWDIPHDAAAILLPRLLLQPLVENAVQHGALCREGGGRVVVRASVVDAGNRPTLVCTVGDNGPGLLGREPRMGALGLHTVRRRLELECPGSAFRLQSSSEGTLAVVEVPVLLTSAA